MFSDIMMIDLLRRAILRQKGAVATTLVLSVLVYTLVSIPPILLGRFVDQAIGVSQMDYRLLVLIVVISVASLGFERLFSYVLTRFSSRLITEQYMQSVRNILVKERRLFEKVKIGEIIDLFSRFINGYEHVFTSLIATFAPSGLAVLILLGAVVYVSNVTVLAAIVAAQAVLFLLLLYFLRRYSHALKHYTLSCYQLSDAWVEILGSNKIIQGEFSFSRAMRRLDHFISNMARTFVKKTLANDMVGSFVTFGQTLSLLIVILLLVYYLSLGAITMGSILTVVTLNYILHSHIRTIADFLVKARNFYAACHDFERISRARGYVREDGETMVRFDELTIQPITVTKGDRAIFTLESSMQWRRGEKICLLGLSGAGKTTFLSLLFNANIEFQEVVSVNGVPVAQIPSAHYQRMVRLSFQENEILSGQGYAEWFQREVDPERARQLLQSLHLPSDIVAGHRTLEPWSGNISGGEAKRLNVARLLMMPGDLNVIDEPTTGLNASLGRRTWEVIFQAVGERALLCATHDLTYVEYFDRVLIIDDGRVMADIPPSALEQNPHFAKIRDHL